MSGMRFLCLFLGGPLLIFGGYILYEKVYLSILTGHSHERVGVVAKVDSAGSFWLGVGVYGFCGLLVALGGIAFIFAAIRTSQGDGTQ